MIAFIIFGTRGIRSTVKEGQFYCPQCDGEVPYKHKKVTQFFTLYFVPLIPLGNKGEYVECQSCKNTYIERILHMRPTIDVTERPQPKRQVAAPAHAIEGGEPKPNALLDKLLEEERKLTEAKAKLERENNADFVPEKQKVIKKLLIMMILADGKVEDSEIHMFHKVYKQMTGDIVADIYKEIEDVRRENKPPYQYLKQVSSQLNDQGKADILKSSMMIAAADGDIDPMEISMVENFGKALEMKPAEIRAIIESVK